MQLFIIFIILSVMGCAAKNSIDHIGKTLSVVEDASYKVDEYIFVAKTNLLNNTEINARKILFQSDSLVQLNQYNLVLIADEVNFEEGSQIIGFDFYDYNPECESHGLNSGSLIFKAKNIRGFPTIGLKGQNSGRHGFRYHVGLNEQKHHPDDIPDKKGWVKNSCAPKTSAKDWNTVETYWLTTFFNGGDNGSIVIIYDDFVDTKEFHPEFDFTLSRGNLISQIYRKPSKKWQYWKTPKGHSGQPSQYCIFIYREFNKCFESFFKLYHEMEIINE